MSDVPVPKGMKSGVVDASTTPIVAGSVWLNRNRTSQSSNAAEPNPSKRPRSAPVGPALEQTCDEILRSKDFRQGSHQESAPFFGRSLLTIDGDEHFDRRRLEAPLFNKAALEFYEHTELIPLIAQTLDEARAERGDDGLVRADLCHLVRTMLARIAAATTGIDGVDTAERTDAFRTYVEQLRLYERQTANAGLSKLHGLRHLYAQSRYRSLTADHAQARGLGAGWSAPVDGGPGRGALTPVQQAIDRLVREQISRELGHEREAVTALYLGR